MVESVPTIIAGPNGPLVFWSARMNSGALASCIRGARLGADGSLVRAFDVTDCTQNVGGPFAAVAGANKVAVVSSEAAGTKTAVKLRYLDGDGFPLHDPLDLIEPRTFMPNSYSIAARGDQAMLAISPGSSYPPIWFFAINMATGLPDGYFYWNAIAGGASAIAATDAGWAIGYESGATPTGAKATLAFLGDDRFPKVEAFSLGMISSGASVGSTPRLARNGSTFALGWVETFPIAVPPRTEGRITFATCP